MSNDKDETQLKTVKTIQFDGADEHWREWSGKVRAFAMTQKWIDAILEDREIKEDPQTDAEKLVKRENDLAVSFLTMSLTDKAYAYIENAKNARECWVEMMENYEPTEQVDASTLETDFATCSMESDDSDPSVWFNELTYLNKRLENIDTSLKKSDIGMMAHIIANLPKSYSEVVTSVSKDMGNLTLRELKQQIRLFYKRTFKDKSKSGSKKQSEMALNTEQTNAMYQPKKFKGTCNGCGKVGHKKADCWKEKNKNRNNDGGRENNDSKEDKRTCYRCQKKGHIARDCPEKSQETGMFVGTAMTRAEDEAERENLCFETSTKDKSEMWLVDSGSTVHVTNDNSMIRNMKPSDEVIVVGNGKEMKARGAGELWLRHKETGAILTLRNVLYVPGFKKNIISVATLMRFGQFSVQFDKEPKFKDAQLEMSLTKDPLESLSWGVLLLQCTRSLVFSFCL